MKYKIFWLTVLMLCATISCWAATSGSKPQWVSKGEAGLNSQRCNETYYFKVIQNIGPDIVQLRKSNTNALAEYIGKRNQVNGLEVMELSNNTDGTSVKSKSDFNVVFRNEFSTDAFYASLVDEYWESTTLSDGTPQYHYYALYAVSSSGSVKPDFDHFEVTRKYGALPVVLSIIPGVGQLYKGQKLKGSLMMGGAVLGAGAIILCENRRSFYQTRIIEQPKFARHYSQKSDNWTTGRNISIGITGALVAWSIIDAAVTPGTTRIKVSPSSSVALRPTALATPHSVGFGASMAFNF